MGAELTDDRIPPAGQLHGEAGDAGGEEFEVAVHRRRVGDRDGVAEEITPHAREGVREKSELVAGQNVQRANPPRVI